MKITALLVLKCNPEGSDPTILAGKRVGRDPFWVLPEAERQGTHLLRGSDRRKTDPTRPTSICSTRKYKVHSYNRNGLCTVGFMDDHYPVRTAFSLLNKILSSMARRRGKEKRKKTH
ncbi:unnamed protein product [Camellia sinensis]